MKDDKKDMKLSRKEARMRKEMETDKKNIQGESLLSDEVSPDLKANEENL